MDVRLTRPVIAIGAPAEAYLPDVARILSCRLIVPPDADVANAVGAITSEVIIRESADIVPGEDGNFIYSSARSRREFVRVDDAIRFARAELLDIIQRNALEAGTESRNVLIRLERREGTLADGEHVLLGMRLNGHLYGKPALHGGD
jgi:hypothetical protein